MADTYPELQAVNVQRELDQMGWAYEFAGDDEVKTCCPAHGDKSPSCALSLEKKVWKCHAAGCGKTGDFISFMAYATKGTRAAIVEYIRQEYDVANVKTIDPEVITKYHNAIWNAGPLLQQLYKRGIDDDSIRRFRLGVDDRKRITIPVYNKQGSIVNCRRYLPGAPSADKMKNTRGMGKIRLYPYDQLRFDTIVITGGECKAIALAQRLNDEGIGAVCATGGEENWEASFSPEFKDKRVFVCYDIDKGGIDGSEQVCARVKAFATSVHNVKLPLDPDKYPAGDVNDYFGLEKATAEDFIALMNESPVWEPKAIDTAEAESEAKALPLAKITQARHAKKLVETTGVITAMDTTPYIIPAQVAVECDRNQSFCANCPVFAKEPGEDWVTLTIKKTSSSILELVNAGKKTKKEAIREGLGIPPCKSCSFHVRSHYNVEDVRLSPQLEISNRSSDSILLPAFTVSHGLEMNTAYKMTGRVYPHPRTQQATFLVGAAEPADDALDTYEPSSEELLTLQAFQPDGWTVDAIESKLAELYEDLSANVTRIFERNDLHLFIDLAYHSPLLIPFDGRIEKGWTELLVVGDSAQGKSEATRRLMEHYGLGEKIEVKNASVAGLLGGLSQMGTRWMVQWGVIPRHDRRLVVLEELKGATTETIGRLTDMRSSGVAEIDKIEKRRTHARTRLLALSNPRSDQALASYSYGIEAVRELIGSPEDLRRFDAVLVVSAGTIRADRVNQLSINRPQVTHKYTSELCKRAILWGWTRHEKDITFDQDAEQAVLEASNALSSKYVDAVPIVDRGSMRFKLARLASALAVRTASFGDEPTQLRVRSCHVEFIARLLDRIYSQTDVGYAAFSEAYKSTRKLNHPKEIRKKILITPYPEDFIEQLLHTDAIELRDICDWTGWERIDATELLSFLVRKHALVRDGRSYRKNPDFIELIRDLAKSEDLKRVSRPSFIKEKGDAPDGEF